MKIRQGFVSNSSSCTYVVAIPKGTKFPEQYDLSFLSEWQIKVLKREFRKLSNNDNHYYLERDNKYVYHRLMNNVLLDFLITTVACYDGDGSIINLCNIYPERKRTLQLLMDTDGANRLMEESNGRKRKKRHN